MKLTIEDVKMKGVKKIEFKDNILSFVADVDEHCYHNDEFIFTHVDYKKVYDIKRLIRLDVLDKDYKTEGKSKYQVLKDILKGIKAPNTINYINGRFKVFDNKCRELAVR